MPTAYKTDVLNRSRRGKTRRNSRLQRQRKQMYLIVAERSNSRCEICLWGVGNDMHHVYGRGKNEQDWREQETALLCVCRTCHPLPIQVPGFPATESEKKAEDALERLYGKDITELNRKAYNSWKK